MAKVWDLVLHVSGAVRRKFYERVNLKRASGLRSNPHLWTSAKAIQ